MAGIGRNALSPDEHKKRGSYTEARHGGYDTPGPVSGKIEIPDDLEGHALAEWHRMVKRLGSQKCLSQTDDAAIYHYAEMYGDLRDAKSDVVELRAQYKKLKYAVDKMTGRDMVEGIHALVDMVRAIHARSIALRQLHMSMRQYLVEFGLTPSARSRIKIPKGKDSGSRLSNFNAA